MRNSYKKKRRKQYSRSLQVALKDDINCTLGKAAKEQIPVSEYQNILKKFKDTITVHIKRRFANVFIVALRELTTRKKP